EPRDLPGQRRHRAPQLGQGDVVVRGVPGPQLHLLVGIGAQRCPEELVQIVADAGTGTPRRVAGRGQLVQHVAPYPGHRAGRVELGGDRVELAALLVDHANGHEVDRAAVLDELAVVEVAVDHRVPSFTRRPRADAPGTGTGRTGTPLPAERRVFAQL